MLSRAFFIILCLLTSFNICDERSYIKKPEKGSLIEGRNVKIYVKIHGLGNNYGYQHAFYL